jgi:hypothetical protein
MTFLIGITGSYILVKFSKKANEKAPPNVGEAFNLTPKINHYFRFFNIILVTFYSFRNCGLRYFIMKSAFLTKGLEWS